LIKLIMDALFKNLRKGRVEILACNSELLHDCFDLDLWIGTTSAVLNIIGKVA